MDWTDLPPLSALRAFAAYARTGSVARAGAALNVSHAAISQQLRTLETHLGVALLDRSARALSLTPEGQTLAATVQDAFDGIADTVAALTGAEAARPLQITCTPSFAAMWLMPRLPRFREAHPGVEMMINPSTSLTDPSRGGIDVALRYGIGPWPGFDVRPLIAAPVMVVGAARFFPDGPPDRPEALLRYPWLQEVGTNEATSWLENHGVAGARPRDITHLPGNLILDGLRAGQGIAIVTRLAVERELEAGRLVVLFEDDAPKGYHVVTLPGPARPPVKAFLSWIRREARKPE